MLGLSRMMRFNLRTRIIYTAILWIVLTATLGCGDSRVENLLLRANEEWVQGRNHSAIELFNAVLEISPSGPQAEESLYRLGEIYYFGLGETTKAISYFQEVVSMRPRGEYAYGAQKYIAEIVELSFRDLDQAIIEYQKLINEYKKPQEHPEQQFRIAAIYFKKHNYDQALVEFDILVESYPKNQWSEEAYLRITEILHNMERCKDAREKYSQFRVLYPKSYLFRGNGVCHGLLPGRRRKVETGLQPFQKSGRRLQISRTVENEAGRHRRTHQKGRQVQT